MGTNFYYKFLLLFFELHKRLCYGFVTFFVEHPIHTTSSLRKLDVNSKEQYYIYDRRMKNI